MLTVAFAFVSATALAADWHVAPSGVDGSSGSEAQPLATLEHALGRAASGDTILLQRGGTYRVGAIDVGSDLHLAAYGSGDPPTVTGSQLVSLTGTWSQNASVRTAGVSGARRTSSSRKKRASWGRSGRWVPAPGRACPRRPSERPHRQR